MKKLEKEAINELISVFSNLDKNGLTEEITKKAKLLYNELLPANTLLSKTVNSAVGRLFSIAYPNVDPERKIPSKEEAKKIILSLKKRKQELEE